MEWGNLRNWLGGNPRSREREETQEQWTQTQSAWRASPLGRARDAPYDLALDAVREFVDECDRAPAVPVFIALVDFAEEVLRAEAIGRITPRWDEIDSDVSVAVEFREMLAHRRRYAADFDRECPIFCVSVAVDHGFALS